MLHCITLLLLFPLIAIAQTFRLDTVYGRKAYVLENGEIRLSALRGGGHLAEIRFLSKDPRKSVNPMRVPHYPTIEPYEYDPARHDALYGNGSHRWLSSGYMGHLLCFPSFGAPSSDEEVRNQLGNHGEAPIVEWKHLKTDQKADAVTLWYAADLPKTQYRVERAITLRKGEQAALVEEWVENQALYDRPINWVQHATFGDPFAEPGKMMMDVSALRGEVGSRGATNSLAPGPVTWPDGISRDGKKVSLRELQRMPHSGTYYPLEMDGSRAENYFTMYHTGYPVLIGYLFPTEDNPWIADWQENKSNQTVPWGGKVVARGIEFGSTPFAEGLRKSVDRGTFMGKPTFRWIPGRGRLKTWYLIFLAEIPAGFAGVEDVRREKGRVIVRERGSGKSIYVPASM